MAKSEKPKESVEPVKNGGEGQQPVQPMLNVLAQYVKDFSFENPNAPNSLRSRDKSPEISINVNVSTNTMAESNFEVELHLEAKAMAGEEVVFNTELNYAGIFRLQGIPSEATQAALLIECPRILFPFARQIIAESTRNGGFPPLMIDPIDFARLYQSRMASRKTS